MRRSGFTLIELLVVTAVIALLLSLLLPVFDSVRAAGRTAACAAVLRQLGVAQQSYAGEHRGWRAPVIDFGPLATSRGFWWENEVLAGYLLGSIPAPPAREAFFVPDRLVCAEAPLALARRLPRGANFRAAYALNGDASLFVGPTVYYGIHDARVRVPAAIAEATDAVGLDLGLVDPSVADLYGALGETDATDLVAYRHAKEANTLFLDGHVAPAGPAEVAAALPMR